MSIDENNYRKTIDSTLDNSLKVVAHNTLLQEWAKRVKECRSSGLSVKEWCKENNVGLSTFYTWQKRVFNAVSNQVQQTPVNSSPVFAEIPKELSAKVSHTNVAATVRVGEICVDFYGRENECVRVFLTVSIIKKLPLRGV